MTRDVPDERLRAELRRALTARTPDRTAMLNRIAANRAADERPRGRSWRLAGSALAVTAVLGVGGVAQWALADDFGAAPPPAAPPTAAAPVPSSPAPATVPATRAAPSTEPPPVTRRPGSAPVRPSTTTTTAPAQASRPVVRGHPGDTQVVKGPLSSAGSVPGTGRSAVTLQNTAELSTLDLTVRVEPAAGLTPDGAVTDAPAGRVTTTVERDGDALLFRFRLRPGHPLAIGRHVFTARYRGAAGGRDAGQDTYEAYADATVDDENKRLHVYGNFATGG